MPKKKNPIKKIVRRIQEYFFFRNKRPRFETNINVIYTEKQFEERGSAEYFAYGEVLQGIFHPLSVVDIGCANGHLVNYFYKTGVKDVMGLERSEAAFKHMSPDIKDRVFKVDLSKDVSQLDALRDTKRYYLTNCTEVGEHIPCKYEDIFLRNIKKFVGKYLVFSWADTWEGWRGFDKQSHVNPRSKNYVIKKMKSLGMNFNKQLTEALIKGLSTRKVYDYWIARIMVFENEGTF